MAMKWYVVKTHHGQEQRASQELRAKAFKTYLPLIAVAVPQKGRSPIIKQVPLIQGYIFVSFTRKQRWQAIGSTIGCNGLLGYHDGMKLPLALRPGDMQALKQIASEFGKIIPERRLPKHIPAGTMLKVLFGPFQDHVGPVKEDLGQRVEVLLNLFGRETPTKLPKDCLAIAG